MKNKRVCLTVAILTMLGTNTFAALPIGDNSIAEGNQAIATGINSIAVGTNAVATGDNLTGKVIKEKLAANEAKLKEIERLKQLVDTEQIDFDRKFEIYNRVESAKKKIATNNELINNTLKPNLDQASQNYNQFKPEYDAVVALMNERLVYISKLDFSLLATNPQNGLDILATELKQKSEDGFPQVNNNLDFYKQYIQNYVKAKGDLDGIIADKRAGIVNYSNLYANNHSGINTNGITLKDIGVWSYIENPHVIAKVNSNIIYEENIKDITKISSMSEIEKNNYILALDKDYNNVISTIESIPESTLFTSGVKQNIIDSYKNKIAYLKAIAESKYQQSIYESLKDTDQAGALQALQNKLSALNEADTYKAKLDDLIKSSDRYSSTYNKWYKENVTDVENSNTLTVKTLSDQYKAAIAEKQSKLDELDRLVKAADAAIKAKEKENAQLQPSQYELDEAAKAEQVKQKLEADKLALEEAKRTLELNNLKNIGLNAISVGNNSLVTGKNAIGIGTNGLITGEDSIGIGHANTISGIGSVAIGTNNSILSNNAFILGNNVNISTGMDGAIVFGNNSTVKAPIAVDGSIPDATVSFGSVGHERQLVNIAKGVVSETSTDAINGSQLFAVKQTISTKVDTNLENITSEGETVIKNLAKGAVKVVGGENTTVTEGTEGDVKTFAVNVSNDAIKTAIQPELDKKANVDGSNVTDANKEKWQENLGDGKAEAGNKGLVSGDTLKKALDNKANSSDLSNKADKNAANITAEDVKEWNKKLGTGTNVAGDTNLVTGDTLYNAIKDFKTTSVDGEIAKDNTDKGVTGDKIYNALENKADTNLGNITSEGETVIKNLAKGAVKVVEGENTTVTEGKEGDVKTFAVNVSNDAIKTAIQPELDKKANVDGSNVTDANKEKWQGNLGDGKAEAGNKGLVSGDTLKKALDNKANSSDLSNKADKNAANITAEDAKAWNKKLGTGTNAVGDTNLITGDTLYKTVLTKSDTSLGNITSEGETVIKNLAKGAVKVVKGENTTVTEGKEGDVKTFAVNVSNDAIKTVIQPELDKKANTNASNITTDDAQKWAEKLGTGSVTEGSNLLVTGDTVYETLKTIKGNPLAVSYDYNKKDVITLQGNNGTKITNLANGVLTKDSTDAVTGSQLFTTNQQVASNTSAIQSLNGSVKEVGAMAGALAALHPLEYDEDYKLSFAAGYGSYKGSNAGAIGAFYRPNENILFNMGTTLTDNDNIVNAGVSFKFGSSVQKTKPQKDMEELKNRMKMLEDLVNKLVDENNHLKKLSTARKSFADVPKNHWAAEAVETLHANNILEGYPDGEFKGDRNMSRYEYAQMIYKTTHELTK